MPRGSKGSGAVTFDAETVLARYAESLEDQPLAERTRGAYRAQVQGCGGFPRAPALEGVKE